MSPDPPEKTGDMTRFPRRPLGNRDRVPGLFRASCSRAGGPRAPCLRRRRLSPLSARCARGLASGRFRICCVQGPWLRVFGPGASCVSSSASSSAGLRRAARLRTRSMTRRRARAGRHDALLPYVRPELLRRDPRHDVLVEPTPQHQPGSVAVEPELLGDSFPGICGEVHNQQDPTPSGRILERGPGAVREVRRRHVAVEASLLGTVGLPEPPVEARAT